MRTIRQRRLLVQALRTNEIYVTRKFVFRSRTERDDNSRSFSRVFTKLFLLNLLYYFTTIFFMFIYELWTLANKLLLLLSFRSVSNFDKCATRDFPLDERNRFATRGKPFAFTNSAGNLENGGRSSLSLSIYLSE